MIIVENETVEQFLDLTLPSLVFLRYDSEYNRLLNVSAFLRSTCKLTLMWAATSGIGTTFSRVVYANSNVANYRSRLNHQS